MRRFWKTVTLETREDGQSPFSLLPNRKRSLVVSADLTLAPLHHAGKLGVLLDKRTLKTPGGVPMLLNKRQLPVAVLVAEEWENQVSVLKPHTLPMVSPSLSHKTLLRLLYVCHARELPLTAFHRPS